MSWDSGQARLGQVGEGGLGTGPEVRDAFGRGQRAQVPARREVAARGEPVEEAGRVLVTRAGGVDQRADGHRVDHVHVVARDDDRAVLAAGEGGDVGVVPNVLQRVVEVVDLVE